MILYGIPVSSGVVIGKAYIPDETHPVSNIEDGMILVTDLPRMVLVIEAVQKGISALVTTGGTRISHGCVFAKSEGVPCVASVSAAMEYISRGDTIRVDGELGTIEIINKTMGEHD